MHNYNNNYTNACTRASFDYVGFLPLCKLQLVPAFCSYTSFQDNLDLLQLALVVFFSLPWYHQLMQKHNLHSSWSSPATFTGFVFLLPTCPFTVVHKHIWARIATCTVWWCLWLVVIRVRVCAVHLWYCYRVLCVCVCACVCTWGKETNKKKRK